MASYQTDGTEDLGGGGMGAERETPAEHGLESVALTATSYHRDHSMDLGGGEEAEEGGNPAE